MTAAFPSRWSAHIAARVPRYTSYPTADRFTPAVRGDAAQCWMASLDPAAPLSLYVHVPFCRKLCLYCGCNTQIVSRHRPIGAFAADLAREIDAKAAMLPRGMRVRHLHFGGGTPTALLPREFAAIMDGLRSRFAFTPDAEIAVEIDPRNLGGEMIVALADAGVTRASLGVQDFDPGVQRAVNRVQPAALVAETVLALRGAGIAHVSFDLIHGLPLQTPETVALAADLAAAMRPDRVALFGYAHVPWMKPHQKALERHGLPDARARWDMARAAEARLAAAGYARVGMDHFALPGDKLALAARGGRLRRNFQGYTADDCPALIGFGPSAISALPQGYVQAPADIADWRAALAPGELPAARGMALGDDDLLRRAVIERLMCDMRVDLDALCRDSGVDTESEFADELDRLAVLADEGLVVLDDTRVSLTEAARPLVRSVAAVFDAYLTPGPARHAVAV